LGHLKYLLRQPYIYKYKYKYMYKYKYVRFVTCTLIKINQSINQYIKYPLLSVRYLNLFNLFNCIELWISYVMVLMRVYRIYIT